MIIKATSWTWLLLVSCSFAPILCRTGPSLLMKDGFSTALYPRIPLESTTVIFFEFQCATLKGRLLYAENVSMGTFISIKLVDPGTLRFEMKILKQVGHQFIILSAILTKNPWHSVEIRIDLLNGQILVIVDGEGAYPASVHDIKSPFQDSFGDTIYVGRLQNSLLKDASKVVHFTAAMEKSFVGLLRNFIVSFVKNGLIPTINGMHPYRLLNGAELATGITWCHNMPSNDLYLLSQVQLTSLSSQTSKAIESFQVDSCPKHAVCMDGNDGPHCGCRSRNPANGFCLFRKFHVTFEFFAMTFEFYEKK